MDKAMAPSSQEVEDAIHPTVTGTSIEKDEDLTKPWAAAFDDLTDRDKKVMTRLRWKIDLWILPLLSLIFFLASLDRTDIGNLQVAGMQKAIHADNTEWAQVVSLFYIGYILSQPPGTLALRTLTPPITIGGGVIAWGVLTVCLMFVHNWSQAVAVRIFLGAGEGFIHAASLYLSFWYGPGELTSRAAIYFSTSTLAGAFNGLLSAAILTGLSNDHVYKAWQWIALVEGVITIGIGVIVVAILPPVPERVKWGFTADEKRLAVIRTWRANNTPNAKFKWHQVAKTFMQPAFYTYVILFCANQIALTGLGSFLPAIVQGMGYTGTKVQLMTVPVYAVAFVTTLAGGFISDKMHRHGYCIAVSSAISLVGYIMLIADEKNHSVRYAGVCLAAAGQFPITVMILVWNAYNTRAFTHRATATTLIAMFGQAAALGGLQGFNTPPYYHKGNAVVLAVVCLMPPAALYTSWYYHRLNQKKIDSQQDPLVISQLRSKSFEELGGDHPDFMYSI